MSARVGVVIRTKDRPYFLARALRDVAGQTFSAWDIVVVNDGGDRGQVERIVEDAALGERARIIDTPQPTGRCAAANAGVRAVTAPLVVLHDDDDRWEPGFLTATVEWLDAHPAAAGVTTPCAIVYEKREGDEWVEDRRVPFWDGMARLSLTELLRTNRVVPISFVYRTSVHDEVGWYDEELDAVEDWHFLLRILPGREIGFVSGTPLALWTQRPDASGASANSMFFAQERHVGDDALVRDRELGEWVRRNGLGLPLLIAAMERDLEQRVDDALARQREWMRHEIDAHQPIMRRLRRLRRRLSRGRE